MSAKFCTKNAGGLMREGGGICVWDIMVLLIIIGTTEH